MSAIGTIIIRTAGGAIGTMIVNRGPAGSAVTVETTIIDGNTNAVSGNAVFDAINALTGAVAPTAPGTHVGQQYRDTVTSIWYRWTGTVWQEDAGASTAADVAFTPAGGIAATDVQAALVELAGTGTSLTDYEITSAYGRRLIASLKTVWPVSSSLAGILYFATTKVVAGTFTVRTTTGYARVIDHRGVLLTQVGTGSSTSDISLALPQANVGQRAYAVISVANGGSVRSGDITRLTTISNEVTAIEVASTTALTYLLCYGNQLTELDVSANTALTILDCNTNQLTTLDVSTNTALTNLTCGTNQLTALDVSTNTALTNLSCGTNQLTTLDVSTNTALTTLTCSNNLLPTAVVDQILVDLDARNVDGNYVFIDGTGNGAASATGIAAAAGLVTDGWSPVAHN